MQAAAAMMRMPICKEHAVRNDEWCVQGFVQRSKTESSTRDFENHFQVLTEQFRRPLVAFLCRLLGDQRRAEDIAVETFVRLSRRTVGDGEFAIALYRLAIEAAAEPAARSGDVERSRAPLPGTRSDIQSNVKRCIAGLHGVERVALVLRQYQNLSSAQIGSVLAISEKEVRVLLVRAYQTVRQRLSVGNSE